jgi:hypothetical protein
MWKRVLAAAALCCVACPEFAAAESCPSLTSTQSLSVSLDGVRAAQMKPGAAAALVLYGEQGVFLARVLGDGTVAPPVHVPGANEAWPIDVNGDGRDDLVLRFPHDSLGVALTSPTGEPGPVSSWLIGRWLAAGDLDGDHRPEIAVMQANGDIQIAWNDRHGLFDRVTDTGLSVGDGVQGTIAIGDLMGTPAAELVVLTPGAADHSSHVADDPDTVRVYRASRVGALDELTAATVAAAPPQVSYYHREALVADLDGRRGGELLLLRAVGTANGNLQVLRVDAAGQLVADPVEYGFEGEDPGSLTIADLDGDGDLDVACGATSDALWATVQIRWNDGSGGLAETCKPYRLYSTRSRNIAAGDYDGDGAVDIAQALEIPGIASASQVALTLGAAHRGKRPARFGSADLPRVASHQPSLIREVFPNPVRGVLMVRLEPGHAEPVTIELFDLAGRRIMTKQVGSHGTATVLDTRQLPRGTYRLAVRDRERISASAVTVTR